MATSLSDALGSPTEVRTKSGITLKASPLTMADWGEIERKFHRERCPDPFEEFERSIERLQALGIAIDPKLAFEQAQLAIRERADRPDIFSVEGQAWLGTIRGRIAVLTASFKHLHPEITEETILQVINDLVEEERRKAEAAAKETDDPKSGSSPAASSGRARNRGNQGNRAREGTGQSPSSPASKISGGATRSSKKRRSANS